MLFHCEQSSHTIVCEYIKDKETVDYLMPMSKAFEELKKIMQK